MSNKIKIIKIKVIIKNNGNVGIGTTTQTEASSAQTSVIFEIAPSEIQTISENNENNSDAQSFNASENASIFVAQKIDEQFSRALTANENSSTNAITGNAINGLCLETNLSSILEHTTTVIVENNSNNAPSENAVNSQTTETLQQKTEEQTAIENESKELKIKKLSKIRKEVKEKTITVKDAIEELRLEELKHLDVNEIEDETEAVVAESAKASEGNAKAEPTASSTGALEAVNIRTTQTNNTLGSFSIVQYNSTCAGFRFGSNGGLILSCAP